MLMRVRWRGGHPKLRNEAVSADYIKEAFRPERLRKHHDHLQTVSQPVTKSCAYAKCGQASGGGVEGVSVCWGGGVLKRGGVSPHQTQ